MAENKRAKGARYEELAAQYLLLHGFTVTERNFRSRSGEIDIIAEKDGVTVYCEVKFRSGSSYGAPEEAVDFRKRQRLVKTAMYHRYIKGYPENKPCRFDVIAFCGDEIRHIENAFEA